jgi:hypothetical protein
MQLQVPGVHVGLPASSPPDELPVQAWAAAWAQAVVSSHETHGNVCAPSVK